MTRTLSELLADLNVNDASLVVIGRDGASRSACEATARRNAEELSRHENGYFAKAGDADAVDFGHGIAAIEMRITPEEYRLLRDSGARVDGPDAMP